MLSEQVNRLKTPLLSLIQGHAERSSPELLSCLKSLALNYTVSEGSGDIELAESVDLIDDVAVAAQLGPKVNYEHHWVLDSTSKALVNRPIRPEVSICSAEMQVAGRGRRGRQWVSPFAQNLYVSWLGYIRLPVNELSGLSIAVGIHWARMLRSKGYQEVGLKWPNDLLTPEGKLGGILIEVEALPNGASRVCVGVGLNVYSAPILGPSGQATSCLGRGPAKLRTELVIAGIAAITEAVQTFSPEVMLGYQSDWHALDCYNNRLLQIVQGEEVIEGRSQGIDLDGGLILKTSAGDQVFHAGEVSLRAK
jgi:BirA family biotin operon repressor/biotin-[acetyl-CoA-carboxylase] ligase